MLDWIVQSLQLGARKPVKSLPRGFLIRSLYAISMLSLNSIRKETRALSNNIIRNSLVQFYYQAQSLPLISALDAPYSLIHFSSDMCFQRRCYRSIMPFMKALRAHSQSEFFPFRQSILYKCQNDVKNLGFARYTSGGSVEMKVDNGVVKFSFVKPHNREGSATKGKRTVRRVRMSKKAKVNELRLYRLKAKKKMNSPNPEVRIRYKLEKAKRKEAWLVEKLRKFEIPKPSAEVYDPEILTEEEKHYLKRTGEKKKNFILLGRRGVFGGVVLNMHLHWKKHETVKIFCKPCKPGQVQEFAEELTRLSKGIVIDIKPNNSIIFYRGKNYVQPEIMSPPDTLSKAKALEKFQFEQSLEHTSLFIEKLEKELEEYQKHVAQYKRIKGNAIPDSVVQT